MDHHFRIALIHPILNFRKFVDVFAADHYMALSSEDVKFLQRVGYVKVESCKEI